MITGLQADSLAFNVKIDLDIPINESPLYVPNVNVPEPLLADGIWAYNEAGGVNEIVVAVVFVAAIILNMILPGNMEVEKINE